MEDNSYKRMGKFFFHNERTSIHSFSWCVMTPGFCSPYALNAGWARGAA